MKDCYKTKFKSVFQYCGKQIQNRCILQGDLIYHVERAYFKQVCLYIPSDKSVHIVVRVVGFLICLLIVTRKCKMYINKFKGNLKFIHKGKVN